MSWVILDFVDKLATYSQRQEINLAEAVANNDVTKVNDLLKKGIDPNLKIVGDRLNPLLFLAFQKSFFTLPASSAYNVEQNLYKITSRTECLRLLLEYGADPNLRNNFGRTALDIGIIWCLVDTVKLLLVHGADPNQSDRQGITPLMKTVILGIQDARPMAQKLSIAQYLLDFGADINAQTPTGMTALMYAVVHNRIEMIELLLKHGASLSTQNHQGHQACDLIPDWLNRDRYNYLYKILTQPQLNVNQTVTLSEEPEGDRLLKAILSAAKQLEDN